MVAIVTLLATLAVATIVTRAGAVALMMTGLASDVARFEARSAFFGVGFTTSEAEAIIHHPQRRRIIMRLMTLGNMGLAALASTAILSALSLQQSSAPVLYTWSLIGGLSLLILLGQSTVLDRWISRLSSLCLCQMTSLNKRAFLDLLHMPEHHGVTEVLIAHTKLTGKSTLGDMIRVCNETQSCSTVALGLQTGRHYINLPSDTQPLKDGDVLYLYGPADELSKINAVCKNRIMKELEESEPSDRSRSKSA
ncbi:MAG: hypothetical protein ACPGXK_11925 [Phycisphaerae bacterium]